MKFKAMLLAVLVALPSVSQAAGALAIPRPAKPIEEMYTRQQVLDMQMAAEFKMAIETNMGNPTQVEVLRKIVLKYLRAKGLANPDKVQIYNQPQTK